MISESEEFCNICLQPNTYLKSVNEADQLEKTYLDKLKLIASNQDWQDFYLICNECITLLNNAYKFHGICTELETLRKQINLGKQENSNHFDSDSNELSKAEEANTEDLFQCEHCKIWFKSHEELLQHTTTDHKKEQYICDICNEEFSNRKRLLTHKKIKHKNFPTKKKRTIIPDKFYCELCNEKFSCVKHITKHYITVHSMSVKKIRPYSCSVCHNRFNSSGTLYQHKLYHSRNRIYICSICGKGFITKRDLINHEVIHSDRRDYKCEPCDKSFISSKNLKTHILIVHTDSKLWRFECTVCKRRFAMKSSFDQHVQRHVGEKKFCCHICENKSFVTNSELRRHLERHTNAKNNKCEHCSKEYRTKQSLTKHLASSHGIGVKKNFIKEKKHACTYCPSRFYDKNKLTRHIYSHTGERPFSCYMCEKRFTDRSYIKGHLKSVHGVMEENVNNT